MRLSSGRLFAALGLMLGLPAAALAASPTWTFVDAYMADWPVAVACSVGTSGTIDANNRTVHCAVGADGSVTFSVAGKLACTANFDQSGAFVQATSTCKPVATSANTLVFAANQGVVPSVLWTFNDGYPADLASGVAVACPNAVSGTINTATPSVACPIPANGSVTFTVGGVLACTANFDTNSQYLPATSTCQPVSTAANTLVFPATQGVALPPPAANVLAIGFPGPGLSVSCVSGACGTITPQQVVMAQPMKQNGAMTLGLSTGVGASLVSCNVAFYDNFVDNRSTTCEGVSLLGSGVPGADQALTFPTQTSGSNTVGQLSVYPVAPPSDTQGILVGNRTVTFVNQCSAPVWFSLVSGTVGPKPGSGGEHGGKASGNLCAGDPDGNNVTCAFGTSCRYVDDTQAYCFYNPADPVLPASGNRLDQFKLAGMSAGGTAASSSVTIPIYQENDVVFSGGASGRLGCQDDDGNYVHCAVGNCNGDNNALGCGYSSGTENGATIAEFTLQAKAIDYYDLSIINGAHVPMKMAPSSGQTPDSTQQASIVGYYWCGAPGAAAAAASGQPGCDWNLASHLAAAPAIPAEKAKYFVSVSAPTITGAVDLSTLDYCAADSDCTAPSVCGLSLDLLAEMPEKSRASLFSATGANGKSGPYTCGSKLGYNTPVNICSLLTEGDDGFLHCNKALLQTSPAGGSVSLTNANLYACNGNIDNCIKAESDYSGTVCCGCTTWSALNPDIASGESDACTFANSKPVAANTNTAWDGTGAGPDVKGKIAFLKQACPSAYAYQFDDATSTFNCYVDGASKSTAAGYNVTDYTITFCPSGTELN